MSTSTNLGKVAITPKGTYSAATAYNPLDAIFYLGTSYLVLKAVTGITPTNDGVNYQYLAQAGITPLLPITPWVTGTNYVVGPPASFVSENGSSYECLISHAAGVFATDLAAGVWGIVSNGVATGSLATGILKNTTGTGAISIAVAGDFPILNQNTTGTAALAVALATARTINFSGITTTSVTFDGSANITIPVTAVPSTLITGTLAATNMPAFTGDVTSVVDTATLTIMPGAVTLGKLANLPADTLIGNGTLGPSTPMAITLGTGLALTSGVLSITGVTSVALSLPAIFAVAGSPVTTSGTLAATLATQTANAIFAGPPSGIAASPTFRTLVTSDLPTLTINNQTGTTYTLALSDGGNEIAAKSATAATYTIPTNATVAFPIGTQILVAQLSAGQVTFSPAAGVTLNTPPYLGLTTSGLGAVVRLTLVASNVWTVNGDLIKLSTLSGTAILAAGTVTVNTTSVLSTSMIVLTNFAPGGTVGFLSVGTITPGVSFIINSSSSADTSTIHWQII